MGLGDGEGLWQCARGIGCGSVLVFVPLPICICVVYFFFLWLPMPHDDHRSGLLIRSFQMWLYLLPDWALGSHSLFIFSLTFAL